MGTQSDKTLSLCSRSSEFYGRGEHVNRQWRYSMVSWQKKKQNVLERVSLCIEDPESLAKEGTFEQGLESSVGDGPRERERRTFQTEATAWTHGKNNVDKTLSYKSFHWELRRWDGQIVLSPFYKGGGWEPGHITFLKLVVTGHLTPCPVLLYPDREPLGRGWP